MPAPYVKVIKLKMALKQQKIVINRMLNGTVSRENLQQMSFLRNFNFKKLVFLYLNFLRQKKELKEIETLRKKKKFINRLYLEK